MDDHTQEGLELAGPAAGPEVSPERPEINDLCVNTVRFLCVDAV